MKHWIERIADELNEMDVEKHVIASGTSISGSIHIGNSCDVFIANAIGKALRELGNDAETIWIADDHDPLRKVPFPLPESYDKYLGPAWPAWQGTGFRPHRFPGQNRRVCPADGRHPEERRRWSDRCRCGLLLCRESVLRTSA